MQGLMLGLVGHSWHSDPWALVPVLIALGLVVLYLAHWISRRRAAKGWERRKREARETDAFLSAHDFDRNEEE